MGKSLLHLGIEPNLPKTEEAASSASAKTSKDVEITSSVPDVSGLTVTQARQQLQQRSFPVGVLGKGSKVLQQLPKGGSVLPASQRIYLLTDTKPGNVPDLTGLSLRDALEMCSLLKVVATVEGQGYVTGQKAVKVDGKWILQLTLSPHGQAVEPPAETSEASSEDSSQAPPEG